MKQYEKIINGKTVVKLANKIVVVDNNMQIFNPTEEQLFADGWVVYEPKKVKLTAEELLERERETIKDKIERYDTSERVNEFYVSDQPIWLDREERGTLERRFRVEQKNGLTTTTLWKNGIAYPMVIENAIIMLDALEMYAIQCHDNTQKHLAAIQALQTIEEIESYDYKAGYPEKLRF